MKVLLVVLLVAGCSEGPSVPLQDYAAMQGSYDYMRKERDKTEHMLVTVCVNNRDVEGVRRDCHGYADLVVQPGGGWIHRDYLPGGKHHVPPDPKDKLVTINGQTFVAAPCPPRCW